MSIPELKLKQGKDRALRFRHPWIFSGAIQRIPNSLTPGTIVDLLSADGAFYARGTFEGGSIAVKILSFARETIDQVFFEARLTEALDIEGGWEYSSQGRRMLTGWCMERVTTYPD